MKLAREELLGTLESVAPGIATGREILEHSGCFIFEGKTVTTFNDEIMVQAKSPFGDTITGAVQAVPFLEVLRKMPDREVEISLEGTELIVHGRNRKAGIRTAAESLLPLEKVDKRKNWQPLKSDFVEGLKIVQECAGCKDNELMWTCIHIHPKWVEACDNYQMARFRVKTPVSGSILVRAESLKHVSQLDVTQVCETPAWLFFKDADGLVIGCRRWGEEYQDLRDWMNVEGSRAALPKGLASAADKANIFSKEDADDDQILVELRPGKVRVKGVGASGWYTEVSKLQYEGPPMSFLITPQLLIEIVTKHPECVVSESALKVDGGKMTYVTRLSSDEEGEK